LEVLLGIDIGNTNIKCVAIEPNGNIVQLVVRSVDGCDSIGNANRLFNLVCNAMREVVDYLPSGVKVAGLAISSIGCSAFFLDKSGEQVTLGSSTHVEMPPDFTEATGYPTDYQNAGVELMRTKDGLSKIAYVLSTSDYISYRLSGIMGRDISTAGSMSMLDRRTGNWWSTFKSFTGLTDDVLGKIYPSGTRIGEITEQASGRTGVPKGVPVCLGGHDYLCAAFALGCVDETSILNVLGTYEMVSSFYRSPIMKKSNALIFSDCHCYPGRYSLTCETLSGSQLEWLRSNLSGGEHPDFWDNISKQMDSLSPSFEGGGQELFIPRIFGEDFPVRKRTLRGGFIGLDDKSDKVRLMRAAFEGLSMNSRRMIESILSNEVTKVIVAGGGSKSRFWLQTKADILGMPLIVPQVSEASATGAALLAGVGVGIYSGHDEASKVLSNVPMLEYHPDKKRTQLYERVYKEVFLPLDFAVSDIDEVCNDIAGLSS
jgi:xylulokinase